MNKTKEHYQQYSREYRAKYPHGRNPVTKVCLNCQKTFLVKPYRKNKAKACSVSCGMYLRKGPLSPAWKGGKSLERNNWQASIAAKEWRKAVFERDNYTCVECGDNTGGNLNADHIKPWAYYPDLRTDINNGRTLCVPCHKETPTWGSKARKLFAQGAFA